MVKNAMVVRFNRTGAKAAAAKRPLAFSVPDWSVTMVMNSR